MAATSHIVPFAGPDMPLRGDDWLQFLFFFYGGMASHGLLCRTFRSRDPGAEPHLLATDRPKQSRHLPLGRAHNSMTTPTITHHMRPGTIWGTQILCEDPEALGRGEYVAELSQRGLQQVDCPRCLKVMAELKKLWGMCDL